MNVTAALELLFNIWYLVLKDDCGVWIQYLNVSYWIVLSKYYLKKKSSAVVMCHIRLLFKGGIVIYGSHGSRNGVLAKVFWGC